MGYPSPNFTQTPNLLLDKHLPEMGCAECKVVLAIVRQTYGWHKKADKLSISQLQELTGLSRQGVLNGTEDALDRGVIQRSPNGQSYDYWLVIEDDEVVNEVDHPEDEVVNEVDHQVVNEVDPQNKEYKENGSSGSARPRMPDDLLPLYDTYQPEVEEYLAELTPEQADRLVMREWGQSSVGSTTARLARDYEWPYFVSGVVIAANEANNPNPRYLDTLLNTITSLDEHTSQNPNENEQQTNLQRLWSAAKDA